MLTLFILVSFSFETMFSMLWKCFTPSVFNYDTLEKIFVIYCMSVYNTNVSLMSLFLSCPLPFITLSSFNSYDLFPMLLMWDNFVKPFIIYLCNTKLIAFLNMRENCKLLIIKYRGSTKEVYWKTKSHID